MKTMIAVPLLAFALASGLQPALGADEAPAVPVTATLDPDGVQRVTMTLDSYSFGPAHLIVAAGKPVELTLVSESSLAPHNIVIDDPASGLDVDQDVGAGKTVKLTFTPARPGNFTFYCDKKAPFMKSHREKGMEGVLEVR